MNSRCEKLKGREVEEMPQEVIQEDEQIGTRKEEVRKLEAGIRGVLTCK